MSSTTNLIGDPIDPAAIEQLNARARLLSSTGYQDDTATTYKVGAHNAYVKLSSFVSIKDPALAKELGVGVGTELAQKWALFNGDVSKGGSNGSYQNANVGGGAGSNTGYLHGYGQGGYKELGIKPMPGIVSLDIAPAGTAGSIRQATVKFKCHNLRQLDIIDVLYLRFGFSMLLEWGHSKYIDNDGHIQPTPTPIDVFQEGLTKDKIHKILAERRRTSLGNYDGMLGLVTNYEWAATVDGGYECTLKLSGIGGVIESLKINTNSNWPGGSTWVAGQGPFAINNKPTQTSPYNFADSGWVNGFNLITIGQRTSTFYESSLSNILVQLKESIIAGATGNAFAQKVKELMAGGLDLGNNPGSIDGYTKGFNAGYMSGIHTSTPDIDFNKIYACHYQSLNGPATSDSTAGSSDQAYIPLGLLIAILNNSCIAYDRTNKSVPLVYLDFNPDTNYCFRLPDQVSLDPRVCLIDSSDPNGVAYQNWLLHRGVPNVGSLDPPAEDTATQGIMAKLLGRVNGNVVASYQDYEGKVATRGHIMRILVNIDHVLGLIASVSHGDDTSSVALSTLLSDLMRSISKVTGNINEFEVIYDDESNVVRIVDQQLVHNDNSKTGYPTIQTFGLSSGVRNMTFKTEASSKMGSMLAIEAMAAERFPTTAGSDGSAFSALNARLKDRLIEIREREANPNQRPASDSLGDKASRFTAFRRHLYMEETLDPEGIADNINFYSECMNAYKSQKNAELYGTATIYQDSVTARGILPLSINLTMNGISTIKMREGFTIPVERLPAQYRDGKGQTRVGFVIAGLNQSIQGQTWLTTIRGQMVNIPSQKTTAPEKITVHYTKPPGVGNVSRADSIKSTALYNNAAFRTKLQAICAKYGINEADMLRIMYAESGITTQAQNKTTRATGLIQFMPDTAKGLGTTVEVLSKMNGVQQLDYVDKFLASQKKAIQGANIYTLYCAIFVPALVPALKSGNDSKIVQYTGASAATVSRQNGGIARAVGKKPGEPVTVGDFKVYVNSII